MKAEGIDGAVPAEQDIDRAGAHMGHQPGALRVGLAHIVQLLEHPVPVPFLTEEQHEIDLALVLHGQALHPVHFLFPVLEIRHQAVDAPAAQFANHPADTQQLRLIRIGAGHGAAGTGGMQLGTGGGEPQCTGFQALPDDGGHARHVLGAGLLVVGTALPHDIGAHCAMGHLGAHVDRAGKLLDGVQVLGETFPSPLDTLVQCGARNILHVLDHRDQPVMRLIAGLAGCETDTAVAHDQGSDAMVGRRAAQWIPGGLPVHVRVHVHPTRGEELALGIYFLLSRALDIAHGSYPAPLHRQTALESRPAGAVDYRGIADHQVVHIDCLCSLINLPAKITPAAENYTRASGDRLCPDTDTARWYALSNLSRQGADTATD